MAVYQILLTEECGGEDRDTIEASDAEEAAETARARLGRRIRAGSYGDAGALVMGSWAVLDGDGATLEEGRQVVTIEPNHDALVREAGGSLDCDHDWTSEGEGGVRQNRGVWMDGTRTTTAEHCRACGLHRTTVEYGAQRNPGQADRVHYSQPETWCHTCGHEDCQCDPQEASDDEDA